MPGPRGRKCCNRRPPEPSLQPEHLLRALSLRSVAQAVEFATKLPFDPAAIALRPPSFTAAVYNPQRIPVRQPSAYCIRAASE
jgi:hypothetical protein